MDLTAEQQAKGVAASIMAAYNGDLTHKHAIAEYSVKRLGASGRCIQYSARFYTARGKFVADYYLGHFYTDNRTADCDCGVTLQATYAGHATTRICKIPRDSPVGAILQEVGVCVQQCADLLDVKLHGKRCIYAAILPDMNALKVELL